MGEYFIDAHENVFLGNEDGAYIGYDFGYYNYDSHHSSLFYPYFPMSEALIPPPVFNQQILYSNPTQEDIYWYCRGSNNFYPYVKDCASEWEQIPLSP